MRRLSIWPETFHMMRVFETTLWATYVSRQLSYGIDSFHHLHQVYFTSLLNRKAMSVCVCSWIIFDESEKSPHGYLPIDHLDTHDSFQARYYLYQCEINFFVASTHILAELKSIFSEQTSNDLRSRSFFLITSSAVGYAPHVSYWELFQFLSNESSLL